MPPGVRYPGRRRAIADVVTQMEFEIGRIELLAKSRLNKAGYAPNEMIISDEPR